MTKDLLEDLRQNDTPAQDNFNPQPFDEPETDSSMGAFLTEVEWIRGMMEKIQGYISQLRIKHSEILSAPQQNEKTKQEIEELTNAIKAAAGQVRIKLKEMEKMINEEEQVADPSLATIRLKRTQLTTITRRFMEIMAGYNKAQTDYRDACKAQIKLKLEIAECPRTDEELEEMLESENPQIFTQGILMDTQQARQNAADIEARHEDILKLEKSIRELHELFLDLAAMVESQSELIDRIEYNVLATKDHVESAKQSTRKAVEYKTKTRKKKIILICVGVGFLLLLAVILIASLVPRR
ncbi:Snare protein syntaxin 1 [Paragonimus heterotremus]|uniref:Snare protein syntaxin 1 n=1 Tax=Paragonimus heterotremus TaxID=100268 RepID=A0A8J4WQG8_9TREM|nr:Snare protein syntaxin 1 [Paragonimus heterotremus]